ncbi:DUF3305 domain-containing protein [Pseudoduganella sp. GCM10020061]|uniref:DUF3305 domain-containing protein n=1 Tax=Pseudoduganella sp. GCM10020061 TaxID=3317345 RepID=UPI00363FF78B
MGATATLPIAVIMERRAPTHPWAGDAWSAVGVVPFGGAGRQVVTLASSPARETYLVPGLTLELYRDEHEGYFENCIAPESKVFVMWRMIEGRAMPVHVSASYVEGTRMFDSGEPADGVRMPPEIHAWLSDYLVDNYEPPVRKGRARHG